ncbi:MAG: hypothetical protein ABEK59_09405 [Halobacteria archaeon]
MAEKWNADKEFEVNRWRAAKAIVPLLMVGVINVVLLFFWGVDPVWAFVVIPPLSIPVTLGWLYFKHDPVEK